MNEHVTNYQPDINTGIYVNALTKHYQREGVTVPALNNVTLHLARGVQVAIMGPSGSGKTTLLHTLAGIIPPTSGSVRLEGQELVGMKETALSKLRLTRFGFVFQDGQLLPELTNEENVALPLMLSGVAKHTAINQAQAQLASLGLDGYGAYRPGQLSGGQAQRVAIARALITRPQVVFADEPTGALDQATSAEVMSVLTQVTAASGTTLVVVTHDQNVANWLQHAIHMRDGQITSVVPRASCTHAESHTASAAETNTEISEGAK
ncbi:ABC transporter ATP-binding protein [Gleimia coleocanis]|nr:ABC transporter ATP-binding protein [Gleimia coleocanis]